jgi:flagellar biosynthetic protein FliR
MTELLARYDPAAWGGHYAMLLLRFAGMSAFMPFFGSELVPIRMRIGIAAVLAIALVPVVAPIDPAPSGITDWILVAIREFAAGAGIGIAARMIFAGVEAAAALVAGQAGFALANMVDPTSGDQGLSPAVFQNLLFLALFLAADLHHMVIHALIESYTVLPPAAALPSFASMDVVTGLLGLRLFTLAAELAAPALIVTISVDLVAALVGRAMPQVPILLVAYPLKLAAGLVAMALLATGTGAAIGWIGRTIVADGRTVIGAMG